METKSRIFNSVSSGLKKNIEALSVKLNEQSWFLELKGKWDELDSQSQSYLKTALSVLCIGGLIFTTIYFISSASSVREEYQSKKALLNLIREARDQSNSAGGGLSVSGNAGAFLRSTATRVGMQPSQLMVSPEKKGKETSLMTENLIDLKLNRVNIRQIIQYALALEEAQSSTKVRHLSIQPTAGPDGPKGFLNAKIAVSHFNLKPTEAPEKK